MYNRMYALNVDCHLDYSIYIGNLYGQSCRTCYYLLFAGQGVTRACSLPLIIVAFFGASVAAAFDLLPGHTHPLRAVLEQPV